MAETATAERVEKITKTIYVESVTTRQVNGKTIWDIQERGGPKWCTFTPARGNAASGYEHGPALIEGTIKTKTKDDGRTFTDHWLDKILPAVAEPDEPTKQPESSTLTKKEWREKDDAWYMLECIRIAAPQFDGLNSASPKDNVLNHGGRVLALAGVYHDAVLARRPSPADPETEEERPALSEHDDGIPF